MNRIKNISKITYRSILFMLLATTFLTCEEIKSYPAEPEISFNRFDLSLQLDDFQNNVAVGNLNFSFTDGDGDLGDDDSISNLFLTMYLKENGKYIKYEALDSILGFDNNYSIPYMERLGQNKLLKGEIDLKINHLFYYGDTIRYTFYITDRAENISNTDTTSDIIFTEYKQILPKPIL